MLTLPRTQAARKVPAAGVSAPNEARSASVYGSRENFRIVSVGPRSDSGGMIALTRLPSGRRASTIGEDSSTRRPTCETMRSMIRSTCASSVKLTFARSIRPLRSMYTSSAPLTMISVTDVVAQERLERSVAEDVVGDLLLDAHTLGAAERRPVDRELLGDRVLDERRELVGRADRVQRGAELRDARSVDPALELRVLVDGRRRALEVTRAAVPVSVVEALGERTEGGSGRCGGLVASACDPVVERHRPPPGRRSRRSRTGCDTVRPTSASTISMHPAREARPSGRAARPGRPS